MKPKLLFLDDRWKRIRSALRKYSEDYDVTVVTNPKECLRYLSNEEFAEVHLDCDLNGDDFVSLASENSVMEVIDYLGQTGWPPSKRKPRFILHSSNKFAAYAALNGLNSIGIFATYQRFVYDERKYHTGVLAGAFDIIHPGYIRMFKDAKTVCEYLIVLLQEDPTLERPGKLKPVVTVAGRTEVLLSIKYVDEVRTYKTEADLAMLLNELRPDVRILGSDYRNSNKITAPAICPIHFHERDYRISTTSVKLAIRNSFKGPAV